MAVEGAVADPVTPPAGGPSDPASPAAGVTKPATSQPEYKWEDDTRTKGTLKDLQTERSKRQEYEKSVAAKDAELAEWKRKVGALSGIKPQDPKEADTDLVRAKMLELYPELGELGSISEIKDALEQQEIRGWAAHGTRIIGQIHQKIASELGVEVLSDRQKRFINAAYSFENENPDFHARHNAGDPKLIEEFVKDIVDNMVEPIRKKATASEASRFRPVPGGRDRSTPIKGEKPKTGEEMLRAHYREKTRQG